MKLIALVLVLAAAAAVTPGADANAPCRDRIYRDWDRDGKIASTYPLSCYRDALRHVPAGDSVYTSLEDDIRAALQAAVARRHGHHVAPQVGRGFVPAGARASMMDERTRPLASAGTSTAAADPASGGGVPTPLIVLGAVALALLVSGGIGYAVRANRGSG